jgi:hypothetical protein
MVSRPSDSPNEPNCTIICAENLYSDRHRKAHDLGCSPWRARCELCLVYCTFLSAVVLASHCVASASDPASVQLRSSPSHCRMASANEPNEPNDNERIDDEDATHEPDPDPDVLIRTAVLHWGMLMSFIHRLLLRRQAVFISQIDAYSGYFRNSPELLTCAL